MKAMCLICGEILEGNSLVIAGWHVLKHVKRQHPESYGLVGVILAPSKAQDEQAHASKNK